jgi:RNA polymerase sigma factor (sigma-70 family)
LDLSVFEKAKAGDSECIACIVEKYYRLAYSTAYDWIRKGVISRDDGLSEAHFALMKCIRGNFDSNKGDFTAYLVKAVDNQIRMYLRRERRAQSIDHADRYVETDDGIMDVLASVEDPGGSVEELAESNVLVGTVMGILNGDPGIKEKEVACLLLRARGLTCDEVAVEMHMSQSYASRLSNNAIEKVQKILKKTGGLDA